jgi:hypothetical protein
VSTSTKLLLAAFFFLSTLSAQAAGPGLPAPIGGGGGGHTPIDAGSGGGGHSTPAAPAQPARPNYNPAGIINSEQDIQNSNAAAGAANNQRDADTINQFDAEPNNQPGSGNSYNGQTPRKILTPSTHGKKFQFTPALLITAPTRAIKAAPALFVGTPIAATRKMIGESKQATVDLAGDNRNPIILSVLAVFGIPFGILSGGTQAPVVAAGNGWKYADQKPFSKEYFSFGEQSPPPLYP